MGLTPWRQAGAGWSCPKTHAANQLFHSIRGQTNAFLEIGEMLEGLQSPLVNEALEPGFWPVEGLL